MSARKKAEKRDRHEERERERKKETFQRQRHHQSNACELQRVVFNLEEAKNISSEDVEKPTAARRPPLSSLNASSAAKQQSTQRQESKTAVQPQNINPSELCSQNTQSHDMCSTKPGQSSRQATNNLLLLALEEKCHAMCVCVCVCVCVCACVHACVCVCVCVRACTSS